MAFGSSHPSIGPMVGHLTLFWHELTSIEFVTVLAEASRALPPPNGLMIDRKFKVRH
jgi:hypothetical protein